MPFFTRQLKQSSALLFLAFFSVLLSRKAVAQDLQVIGASASSYAAAVERCESFDNPNRYIPPQQGVFQCHSMNAGYFAKDFVYGGDLILEWAAFEPSPGNYDYSQIDRFLDTLKSAGRRGYILFQTYDYDLDTASGTRSKGLPTWLETDPYNVPTVAFGSRNMALPVPWNNDYMNRHGEAIAALGSYLRAHDPCKLIQAVQMSAGGLWGGASIYSPTIDNPQKRNFIAAYNRSYDPESGPPSDELRRNFARNYSDTLKETINRYMHGITDRPVVLINAKAPGFSYEAPDLLPGYSSSTLTEYSHYAVSTYGGRMFMKEAGVGGHDDSCGIRPYMYNFCSEASGSGLGRCVFGNCPATRCLSEPYLRFEDFVESGCNYGYLYAHEAMNMDTKQPSGEEMRGETVLSIRSSASCIYSGPLQDSALDWVHEKLSGYSGFHIDINAVNFTQFNGRVGKVNLGMNLSGNLPPHVYRMAGAKLVPESLKLRIYLKEGNNYIDVGYFEPTISSLFWRENPDPNTYESDAVTAHYNIGFTSDISAGNYSLYGAFFDPFYVYNWPVTGMESDSEHRFFIDVINVTEEGAIVLPEDPENPLCNNVGDGCCYSDAQGFYCINGLVCEYGECNIPEPDDSGDGGTGGAYDPTLPFNPGGPLNRPAESHVGSTGPGTTPVYEVISAPLVIKLLHGIIMALAIIIGIFLIVLNGYEILTSQGNPEQLQSGKEGITSAIIGLIFVILSIVIIRLALGSLLGFDPPF